MFRSDLFKTIAILIMLIAGMLSGNSAYAGWNPGGPIKLMIGFKAGGGADTQARLIAEELQARHGWKIIPSQVMGKGGINLANAIKKSPNDGTVIGMFVSETFGYNLVVSKKTGLELDDFTPLVTTAAFEMGIVAKYSQGWKTFHDVIAAAKSGRQIRFGAMSQKLADLAYLLARNNGVEFNIVMTKGGKGVMNSLNAGDIDVGFVAGIQARSVASGDMVNLASGLSRPLKQTPEAPVMKDLGVQFDADGYFMFAAPAGLPAQARQELSKIIAEIVNDPSSKPGGFIQKAFGGASVITGDDLDHFLEQQYKSAEQLLKAVMD